VSGSLLKLMGELDRRRRRQAELVGAGAPDLCAALTRPLSHAPGDELAASEMPEAAEVSDLVKLHSTEADVELLFEQEDKPRAAARHVAVDRAALKRVLMDHAAMYRALRARGLVASQSSSTADQ
jgi:hypothetical protein